MNDLRPIFDANTGQLVRMADLKAGDVFDLYETDGQFMGRWIADEDGFTPTEGTSQGIGSVVARLIS